MELYQLIAVVEREQEEKLEGVFRSAGTVVGYSQPARGTAGRDILARYGLSQTEKRIVAAVANVSQQQMIFKLARKLLYMDIPGNGILAAIPIKAVAGRKTLAYLTDRAVVDAGFADLAMDAAREAGAGGGTVLHAKGTGGARGEQFFSVRFADEKDMLYIVAHKSEKAAVMKAVAAKAGPATEAHGICFSLPISSVMGLRARENDEEAE